MKIRFTKMHGIGNDYIYVNCFEEQVSDPAAVARRYSDRHTGVGSDGLILIKPSKVADVRMHMFNADGSEGAMCGNGVRCVAKYAFDHGLVNHPELTVETKAGIKKISLAVEKGKAVAATVDMGCPILLPAQIPMQVKGESFVDGTLEVNGRTWRGTAVSMGNPHFIVFTENPKELDLAAIGPYFENHPVFPDRTNTEFVTMTGDHSIFMRVWERGSGETMACGTGACATAVASVLNGYCRRGTPITVELLGGKLKINWTAEGPVLMEGPAEEVFEGTLDV